MIYMFNFIDRMIISVVGESIRSEFGLSDFQLGIMGGAAFALFYGGIGIPLARLAERKDQLATLARRMGWHYHCHHTGQGAQASLLWAWRALEGGR